MVYIYIIFHYILYQCPDELNETGYQMIYAYRVMYLSIYHSIYHIKCGVHLILIK